LHGQHLLVLFEHVAQTLAELVNIVLHGVDSFELFLYAYCLTSAAAV
jgi:hypothetical protein